MPWSRRREISAAPVMRATTSVAGVSSDPPSSSEIACGVTPANARPVAVSAAAVTMSQAFRALDLPH